LLVLSWSSCSVNIWNIVLNCRNLIINLNKQWNMWFLDIQSLFRLLYQWSYIQFHYGAVRLMIASFFFRLSVKMFSGESGWKET
jgi:hypothetical protein